MRIGVLEDDAAIGGLLHEILERAGHTVVVHRNGWDFLAEIVGEGEEPASVPFDIALIDLLLPHISGLQTIQQIKAHTPTLPIVVISAASSRYLEAVQQRFPEVKALRKPFKMQDLLAAIDASEEKGKVG